LPSGVLHAVVVAFAVGAIVRDEVSASLRTREPRASISGSDDLTDGDHSPVIRTPTCHQSTNNGSRLRASASVTILLKGLSDRICDAILNASTWPVSTRDLSRWHTRAGVTIIGNSLVKAKLHSVIVA